MFLRKFKYDFISFKKVGLILLLIASILGFIYPLFFIKPLLELFSNESIIFYQISINALFINLIFIFLLIFLCLITKDFLLRYFKRPGYITYSIPISTSKSILIKLLTYIIWLYDIIACCILFMFIGTLIGTRLSNASLIPLFNFISSLNALALIRYILLPVLLISLFIFVLTLSNIRKDIFKYTFIPVLVVTVSVALYILFNVFIINKLIINLSLNNIIKLLFDNSIAALLIYQTIKLIDNKLELA